MAKKYINIGGNSSVFKDIKREMGTYGKYKHNVSLPVTTHIMAGDGYRITFDTSVQLPYYNDRDELKHMSITKDFQKETVDLKYLSDEPKYPVLDQKALNADPKYEKMYLNIASDNAKILENDAMRLVGDKGKTIGVEVLYERDQDGKMLVRTDDHYKIAYTDKDDRFLRHDMAKGYSLVVDKDDLSVEPLYEKVKSVSEEASNQKSKAERMAELHDKMSNGAADAYDMSEAMECGSFI